LWLVWTAVGLVQFIRPLPMPSRRPSAKRSQRGANEPRHNLERPRVVCRDYDRPSHNGVDRHRESEAAMDNRRQQFMLAFVTYMDLRQIEDEELRRKLIADMNRKLDELVAKGAAIPDITPERVAALGLEP
jgi:hypothetical protein